MQRRIVALLTMVLVVAFSVFATSSVFAADAVKSAAKSEEVQVKKKSEKVVDPTVNETAANEEKTDTNEQKKGRGYGMTAGCACGKEHRGDKCWGPGRGHNCYCTGEGAICK